MTEYSDNLTPDQYRRAPIPADGRTIEAMRLALLDTPAGRAMTNAGDTRLYWMNESDAYMLMSPFINTTDEVLVRMAPAPDAVEQLESNADRFLPVFLATSARNIDFDGPWDDFDLSGGLRSLIAAMETDHD